MTLLPLQDPRIRGVEGPKYKVGPYCEAPECGKPADHAHHLWRRSFLSGDYAWVEVPAGDEMIVIGNLVALCWRHHQAVTGGTGGHEARYVWNKDKGVLYWQDDLGIPALVSTRPFEGPVVDPVPVSEPERCPKCGRRKAREKPEGTPRREARRKTRFVFLVPQDTEEDGEALLRELVSQCAERIGRSDDETYYTIADVLNWFLLNYDPAEDEAA